MMATLRLLDLFNAIWLGLLFVMIFLWLPSRILTTRSEEHSSIDLLVSGFARIALITLLGVTALASLHLFNWFTLILLYSSWPLCYWLQRHRGRLQEVLKTHLQQLIFHIADTIERFSLRQWIYVRVHTRWRDGMQWLAAYLRQSNITTPTGMLAALALTIIFSLLLIIRFEEPLQQLRLGHPDSYQLLLETRQLLSSDRPPGQPSLFSTIAAALVLIGSIEPMQVIRFLAPLLGCLLVLGVGYCVRALTENGAAALIAIYSLGAYLFILPPPILTAQPQQWELTWAVLSESLHESLLRQWSGGNWELGVLFLLFALARMARARKAHFDIACCLIIVLLTAPVLLVVALAAKLTLILKRELALAVTSIVWLGLALLTIVSELPTILEKHGQILLLTLPAALALLCGLLFNLASLFLHKISKDFAIRVEAILFILFFAVSINLISPPGTTGRYLEHDIVARKTLEIATRFPRKQWMIAAPVEQFAESYGTGWHKDLAQFVDEFSGRAGQADFRFPFSVKHLFVFVEKQPFAAFVNEPQSVPFSVLADATYRHYRSPAGRASLEFAVLELCEAYRRSHTDTTIYYEDELLRIYHFPLAQ
ncbi:MAG: hypothetical protein AB1489_29715 [Acidobacteriota bacterium]